MVNACCTYSWGNFFCIGANITSLAKTFLYRETTFKHNLYTNLWNQMNCLVLNGRKPLMTYIISSSRKPFCGPWCFAKRLITTKNSKIAIDVMWGLLLIGSQSSGNIRWLVTHSKYFANKVLCSTWLFFHGDNVICFVACNQTFVAFDAQGSNFKAIHGIVTNYTFHNLVGIDIYGLVVI